MKKIVYAAAVLFGAGTSLQAADLGRQPTSQQFSARPIAIWTGFYVGVNGGYGQNILKNTGVKSSSPAREKGGLLGLTLGHNHEFANRIVLGVEADYVFSGIKKSKKTSENFGAGFRVDEESKISTSSFGTARVRAGYSFDSFMPYLTGGLAMITSKLEAGASVYNAGTLVFSNSIHASKTLVGYTAGAGVEAMLTSNISLKVEYLYAGFGSSQYSFNSNTGANAGQAKLSNSMHLGRVGLNYRF
jgi:outer membrane immunogenic protein